MQMTPFQYGDFYDVPRMILLCVWGRWVFLHSAFDEELDDYEAEYSVYRLPSSFRPPPVDSPWGFLDQELACVGKIPVREVQFDESKRRTLSAKALDEIVVNAQTGQVAPKPDVR
jgi:hypothetical protein